LKRNASDPKVQPDVSLGHGTLSDNYSRRQVLGGLVVRRECWTLSWKGRVLAGAVLLGATIAILFGAHPFLAVTQPIKGRFLIVEGWVPASATREAKILFEQGSYQKILTCGGPVRDRLDLESEVTYAEWGASNLRKLGVSTNFVQAVPAPAAETDRTYSSALALKAWFETNGLDAESIDVVTSGCHGRRSHMLFRKAFGPNVRIGIISVPPKAYNSQRWWASSAGVREVLSEGIAYLYALLFILF
jgi:uncharacterized SAM-binding protein YcdF (DUF218 family)